MLLLRCIKLRCSNRCGLDERHRLRSWQIDLKNRHKPLMRNLLFWAVEPSFAALGDPGPGAELLSTTREGKWSVCKTHILQSPSQLTVYELSPSFVCLWVIKQPIPQGTSRKAVAGRNLVC